MSPYRLEDQHPPSTAEVRDGVMGRVVPQNLPGWDIQRNVDDRAETLVDGHVAGRRTRAEEQAP
jgi:hypothetical protein